MKYAILTLVFVFCISCANQNTIEKDKQEILTLLDAQQKAWNENNLEAFMNGYLKSNDLIFYSGGKLKYGWQNTLTSYKKSYPDSSYTGTLKFEIVNISPINSGAYWVMGEYHLNREKGIANGTFMIIFKKIKGEWKIIADSSC